MCGFRSARGIVVYREGERRECGELILSETAELLGVNRVVVRRLIRSGILPARQTCKGAPWIIQKKASDCSEVRAELSKRRPLTPDRNLMSSDFQ